MIDMGQAYRTVEFNKDHYKVLDFKCEHCGQEYGMETVNIAVFLYGVFFLVGKESGYVGINCPRCMKTIMMKGNKDLFEFTKDSLSSYIHLGNIQFDPHLQYHSSVNYLPEHIPPLKGFNIPHWNTTLIEGNTTSVEMSLLHYIDNEPRLNEEYFCSYVFGGEPPMGSFFSVWWFREKDIYELVRIEEQEQLRIFPRCVHHNSVYEDIDSFCWNNHIYLTYLKKERQIAEDGLKELRKVAEERGMDFGELLEANPGIAEPNIIGFMEKQAIDHAKENEFSITFDLMNILAADPFPWDWPGPRGSVCEVLWKTTFPFQNREVPKTLVNIDSTPYEKPEQAPGHDEMVSQLRMNFTQGCVQNFLYEKHLDFITDYILLAQKTGFSYAAVWDLKEQYLKSLYDHMIASAETQTPVESLYVFCQEGPAWRITYEGKTLRGLRGKGFGYIHYLVSRKGEQFHTEELAQLDGVIVNDYVSSLPNTSHQYDNSSVSSQKAKEDIDSRDMVYGRSREELEEHWIYLQKELSQAEESNDPGRIEKAESELRNFEEYVVKYFGKGGKVRKFRNESTRNKDRVTKSIERALNTIRKHHENTWQHFYRSLRPINSFRLSYTPNKDLDWHTE